MAEYTASSAMLEALEAAGVAHLLVNLGSDHPAIMEAISSKLRRKAGPQVHPRAQRVRRLCAAQ